MMDGRFFSATTMFEGPRGRAAEPFAWTPVLTQTARAGQAFSKNAGISAWDGAVHDATTRSGDILILWTTTTANDVMVGLNSDPATDANYTSIDYPLYSNDGGALFFALASLSATHQAGDILGVRKVGTTITFEKNFTQIGAQVTGIPNVNYALDSSIYQNPNTFNLRYYGRP